jgi:hypothetical protein
MKKIYQLALCTITLMSLYSCDCNTDEIVVEEPVIIEKELSYDTQDDLIKIDGYWLDNSNANWDDWQYEQTIGCRINEGFLWVEVDSSVYEIVDMELVNFPFVWYASSVDQYSWYFEGPGIDQYIPNYSEIVHIKIKLKVLNN